MPHSGRLHRKVPTYEWLQILCSAVIGPQDAEFSTDRHECSSPKQWVVKDNVHCKCWASATRLCNASSPIARLPRRDVQDIASHSSRRPSRTLSRIESTIVTDDILEPISCNEFTNVPILSVSEKRDDGKARWRRTRQGPPTSLSHKK